MPLKDILHYMHVCVCVIAMQPKKSPEEKFVCVCVCVAFIRDAAVQGLFLLIVKME